MTIKLTAEMEKIIEQKLQAGDFATAEEVLCAGLHALNAPPIDDFASGELDKLIAEGHESIWKEGTIDVDEAFAELRARRVQSKPKGWQR